jgi:hypothetical protein
VKISKPEYLEKALLLSTEEQERLLSRMTGKLPRRLEKDKLSLAEALAIQLEIEDEQLNEWREKMHSMKESGKQETKAKVKTEEKEKPAKIKQGTKEKAVPQIAAQTPAKAVKKTAAAKPGGPKPTTTASASAKSPTPAKSRKT